MSDNGVFFVLFSKFCIDYLLQVPVAIFPSVTDKMDCNTITECQAEAVSSGLTLSSTQKDPVAVFPSITDNMDFNTITECRAEPVSSGLTLSSTQKDPVAVFPSVTDNMNFNTITECQAEPVSSGLTLSSTEKVPVAVFPSVTEKMDCNTITECQAEPVSSGPTSSSTQKIGSPLPSTSVESTALRKHFDQAEYNRNLRPLRKRQFLSGSSDSADDTDHKQYSDGDYIPNSCSSDESEDSEPLNLKPHVSQRFPRTPPSMEGQSKELGSSSDKQSSIHILPSSQRRTCRVYNKKQYCLFCWKPFSKLARHLEFVHQNEVEVAKAVQFPKR
ncbi:hypothetical protein UPYG_G00257760 [Umbra pygmaea]|uniref:C2H2-type domain-containing protein n=1 Tax=Umbra pygmaea TaxID=75934 RepID=A0ABD0W909_UMBPY